MAAARGNRDAQPTFPCLAQGAFKSRTWILPCTTSGVVVVVVAVGVEGVAVLCPRSCQGPGCRRCHRHTLHSSGDALLSCPLATCPVCPGGLLPGQSPKRQALSASSHLQALKGGLAAIAAPPYPSWAFSQKGPHGAACGRKGTRGEQRGGDCAEWEAGTRLGLTHGVSPLPPLPAPPGIPGQWGRVHLAALPLPRDAEDGAASKLERWGPAAAAASLCPSPALSRKGRHGAACGWKDCPGRVEQTGDAE